MNTSALRATNRWLSYVVVILHAVTSIVFILGALEPVHAANFFCQSGNVTCLIAAINNANGRPGKHTINLESGIYTLQAVDNGPPIDPNGLPSITGSIRIQASADDPPTVIERDAGAPFFRIFDVSVGGELGLHGVTVKRGWNRDTLGNAIRNRGVTLLQNCVVTDTIGFAGAILNQGTLTVFGSIIAHNSVRVGAIGGAITNGGNVLIENSTIAYNGGGNRGGGIGNLGGAVVVRNSSIIFNGTGRDDGGGIYTSGGSVEIVNSTIAKNYASEWGGGVYNFGGLLSITNSTIRENQAMRGGGIVNVNDVGGTVRIQNTIVAGNTSGTGPSGFPSTGPDCLGTITSLGNSLVGDTSGCDINLQATDLTGDPGLGSLVGAGEDDPPGTAHYPVLAGSAVIGMGDQNACPKRDQLGNHRVGICELGAVEFVPEKKDKHHDHGDDHDNHMEKGKN